MRQLLCVLVLSLLMLPLALAEPTPAPATAPASQPLYQEDFSKIELGEIPEDFLVLGGEFAVRERDGQRLLELPGTPLDSYGIVFGPNQSTGLGVLARVHGVSKGRRAPTLGIGVAGVSGYQFRLAPTKKAVELLKNEAPVAQADYAWKSGTWTWLYVQARATDAGTIVEAKAWAEGEEEPRTWTVTWTDTKDAPSGRPSLWAQPYSEQPLAFDDLLVVPATADPATPRKP